jgi:hypothetical protein
MFMKKIIMVFSFVFLIPFSAQATISVGGYDFSDNAFADSLVASSENFSTAGGTLSQVLTDKSADTYAYSLLPGSVSLAFTDNNLLNGPGNDLALFELGTPDRFNVTINGVNKIYRTSNTGYYAGGYSLNVALIDLSDFEVPLGSISNEVVLGMNLESTFRTYHTLPSLALVGALNSSPSLSPVHALNSYPPPGVPIPGTVVFLGSGILGLAGMRLKSRKYQN